MTSIPKFQCKVWSNTEVAAMRDKQIRKYGLSQKELHMLGQKNRPRHPQMPASARSKFPEDLVPLIKLRNDVRNWGSVCVCAGEWRVHAKLIHTHLDMIVKYPKYFGALVEYTKATTPGSSRVAVKK